MATAEYIPSVAATHTTGPFRNEPLTNFGNADNARKMRQALARVKSELGREYALVIGGAQVKTEGKIKSFNPANPSELVGTHQKAGVEHVEQVMQAALAAFKTWRLTPVADRVALLTRATALLRQRKFEFAAWMVYEVGKNWAEADADIAETIDFCEFYAREAVRLSQSQAPVQLPGEVGAGDDLEHARNVGDGSGHWPHVVECPTERSHAEAADSPIGRLQTHNAATFGGTTNGAARIASNCQRNHAGS